MTNPWLKKNPFMSMWFSTANRLAGSIRGSAAAQVSRQLKAAQTKVTNENIKRLSADAIGPTAKKTRKR